MSILGFFTGLGLLGGAAVSKMAAPQSLSNACKTDVVESGTSVAWEIVLRVITPKCGYFYNCAEGCSRIAWQRYLTGQGYSGDFMTRSAYDSEQYVNSLFGYNLEQIYYDIAKNKHNFGLKEEETMTILDDVALKFVCSKMDLRLATCVKNKEGFEKIYNRYIDSEEFLDPKFKKIQRVGEEIYKHRHEWKQKQKEIYIIKSFPECFNTPREKKELRFGLPNYERLRGWVPRASAENLIKLKKEIELVYGSILQDLIHRIWMNGGQGTYLAPGNDSKRARHDGDSLFVHCSVYDYVKYSNTGLYVTGFDFPPVTDYEKEIYEHYAKLRAEE